MPIKTTINSQCVGSCTLFGASGNCIKKAVYYVDKSTNSKDYHTFLEMVIKECTAELPYLVIDIHKAHFAEDCKYLIENYFVLMLIPTYSCEFNSIETL